LVGELGFSDCRERRRFLGVGGGVRGAAVIGKLVDIWS
jgi:hypothetical protein